MSNAVVVIIEVHTGCGAMHFTPPLCNMTGAFKGIAARIVDT